MVNRIGIYGSKVAEGLSAFQRRSCFKYEIGWHEHHHDTYFVQKKQNKQIHWCRDLLPFGIQGLGWT